MIFFNVSEARTHLIRYGYVYTLRSRMRRTGQDLAVYGLYTKWEKIGRVNIQFIGMPADTTLEMCYLSGSGFRTLGKWLAAAKGAPHLYRVELVKEVE